MEEVGGSVLWANLHLLFWLSLIPFVTAWMGENHFETGPTVAYGIVLFMSAAAYSLLVRRLIAHHDKNSTLAEAVGEDRRIEQKVIEEAQEETSTGTQGEA